MYEIVIIHNYTNSFNGGEVLLRKLIHMYILFKKLYINKKFI
jgi:hypothetical protein